MSRELWSRMMLGDLLDFREMHSLKELPTSSKILFTRSHLINHWPNQCWRAWELRCSRRVVPEYLESDDWHRTFFLVMICLGISDGELILAEIEWDMESLFVNRAHAIQLWKECIATNQYHIAHYGFLISPPSTANLSPGVWKMLLMTGKCEWFQLIPDEVGVGRHTNTSVISHIIVFGTMETLKYLVEERKCIAPKKLSMVFQYHREIGGILPDRLEYLLGHYEALKLLDIRVKITPKLPLVSWAYRAIEMGNLQLLKWWLPKETCALDARGTCAALKCGKFCQRMLNTDRDWMDFIEVLYMYSKPNEWDMVAKHLQELLARKRLPTESRRILGDWIQMQGEQII